MPSLTASRPVGSLPLPSGTVGDVLVSQERLSERVTELGAEIARDYQGRQPLLVGVLKGAFVFMSDLARAIDLPVEIDFMAVSSYGMSTESSGVVRILKDLETNARDRHVLLVEDIVDSGLTTDYLAEVLRDRGPASFEICALLVREDARREGIRYVGFEVPADWAGRLRTRCRRVLSGASRRSRIRHPAGMNSKWADGIEPRGFRWVITDRLGVCERPGGYGAGHRRVRRIEEIVWLRRHEIGMILSLTAIPYNLHDYDEYEQPYVHIPFSAPSDGHERFAEVLQAIRDNVSRTTVVVHHDSIGERLSGVVAGYLLWSGLIDSAPEAITITEHLLERELGAMAREMVTMAHDLRTAP